MSQNEAILANEAYFKREVSPILIDSFEMTRQKINTDKLTKAELVFLEQIAGYIDKNGGITNYNRTGKSTNKITWI